MPSKMQDQTLEMLTQMLAGNIQPNLISQFNWFHSRNNHSFFKVAACCSCATVAIKFVNSSHIVKIGDGERERERERVQSQELHIHHT